MTWQIEDEQDYYDALHEQDMQVFWKLMAVALPVFFASLGFLLWVSIGDREPDIWWENILTLWSALGVSCSGLGLMISPLVGWGSGPPGLGD